MKQGRCTKCRGKGLLQSHGTDDKFEKGKELQQNAHGSWVPLNLEVIASACVRREAEELSYRTGYPLHLNRHFVRMSSSSKTRERRHVSSQADSDSTVPSVPDSLPQSPTTSFPMVDTDIEERSGDHEKLDKLMKQSRKDRIKRSPKQSLRYDCRKQAEKSRVHLSKSRTVQSAQGENANVS